MPPFNHVRHRALATFLLKVTHVVKSLITSPAASASRLSAIRRRHQTFLVHGVQTWLWKASWDLGLCLTVGIFPPLTDQRTYPGSSYGGGRFLSDCKLGEERRGPTRTAEFFTDGVWTQSNWHLWHNWLVACQPLIPSFRQQEFTECLGAEPMFSSASVREVCNLSQPKHQAIKPVMRWSNWLGT